MVSNTSDAFVPLLNFPLIAVDGLVLHGLSSLVSYVKLFSSIWAWAQFLVSMVLSIAQWETINCEEEDSRAGIKCVPYDGDYELNLCMEDYQFYQHVHAVQHMSVIKKKKKRLMFALLLVQPY